MSNTSNLVLPYLAAGQAQKHVTVNETLRTLDAIIQLSVVSATTTAEPSTPTDGAVYIVPSGKSGAHWAAFASWSLGYYRDGSWVEIAPREGWLAFVKDTDKLLFCTGSAWSLFPAAKLLTVSATDKLIGRVSSGAGAAEEIALTAAGRALIDDADAAAQRTTLGLGSAAQKNTGTSGDAVGLLNAGNTWSAMQAFVTASQANEGLRISNTTDNVRTHMRPGRVSAENGALKLDSTDGQDVALQTVGVSRVLANSAYLKPASDNVLSCGASGARWTEIWSATGTINTSDAREKTGLRPLGAAEARAIRRVIAGAGLFHRRDAVEKKGEAARLHAGVTAQAIADAFTAEGLDPGRYALFCADPLMEEVAPPETPAKDDGESDRVISATHLQPVLDEAGAPVVRLGVRYDQLFAMALAVLFTQEA
jgi:uncharacterized protein DUF2793/endosialidase-like protein